MLFYCFVENDIRYMSCLVEDEGWSKVKDKTNQEELQKFRETYQAAIRRIKEKASKVLLFDNLPEEVFDIFPVIMKNDAFNLFHSTNNYNEVFLKGFTQGCLEYASDEQVELTLKEMGLTEVEAKGKIVEAKNRMKK